MQTHRRHFVQQSEYTICAHFDDSKWMFVSHDNIFLNTAISHANQDLLWKFNIPASEQAKVLKQLEEYNLNAYSLFGSDESLMETLAIRELLLK